MESKGLGDTIEKITTATGIKTIVDKISSKINPENIEYIDKSVDRRNYKVNFEKVKRMLSFDTEYSIEDGILEIIDYLKKFDSRLLKTKKNIFGNYEI